MNVLMAFENSTLADTLFAEIASMGHTPIKASTGLHAYKILIRRRPDLLFVDIDTHTTWGLQLVRIARILRPTAEIIALTDFPQDERALQALSVGADEVRAKRLAVNALDSVVRRHLALGVLRTKRLSKSHAMELA